MAATRVLVQKELRQHWLAFGILGCLLGLSATGTLAYHYLNGISSSVFVGLRALLQVALPAAALVICGRLVIAEYRAKTQLFLEALPLSRWRMVAVKYLLGLGALLLFVFGLLAVGGAVFRSHEAMTPRFAAILALRAGASALFWYSFFFTSGFLGRYRWPILILIAFMTYLVDTATAWDVSDFGPFKLLDQEFGTERQAFPGQTLYTALAVSGFLALTGFALALLQEGNVSSMLAERMSYREKVLIAAILLVGSSAVGVFEERRDKPPYDLSGAASAHAPGVMVKVAGPKEDAQALADVLVSEFAALRAYLRVDAFPVILVTHREDLDATEYERGQLAKAEGFVVRANYTAENFSSERFLAWLIPELLDHRSHGRTKLEPGRWIRDGVGEFWVRRSRASQPLSTDRDLALRALHAARAGISPKELHEWYTLRERVGEGVAIGLAWSGLKSLVLTAGEDACRAFLQRMYTPAVPGDVRATVHDLKNPWHARLSAGAGLPVERFVEAWNAALHDARAELETELEKIPRLTLEVEQIAATELTTILEWRLTAEGGSPEEIEYRIRYLRLPGLDEPFEEDDLVDESARAKLDAPIKKELAESFSRGTRAVIGAAVYWPPFGCDVISGWKRIDIGP